MNEGELDQWFLHTLKTASDEDKALLFRLIAEEASRVTKENEKTKSLLERKS